MTTVQMFASFVFISATFLLNVKCGARAEPHKTCILDVALLSLQGPNYGVDELCVAGGNKVTIVIRCSSGSRYLSQASINPCLEQQPLVSLQYDTMGVMGGNVSLLLWLNLGHEVVDSAMDIFQPSTNVFKSIKVIGDRRGTKFNFAIAQRCSADTALDYQPGVSTTQTNISHPWQNDAAADSSAVTKKNNPASLQSPHTTEPELIGRLISGRDTTTNVNQGQAQHQPSDAVHTATTSQGLPGAESVDLGDMGEVLMEGDETLHGEITDNPLEELVPGEKDSVLSRLEGLAMVNRVGNDDSKPGNDLNPNVNSEKNLLQNEGVVAMTSPGYDAPRVQNDARSLSNDMDLTSPESSSKTDGAETVSDSSLLTVDPTVLKLVAIIAKARASAAATTATPTTPSTTTQPAASNSFFESEDLRLKNEVDSTSTFLSDNQSVPALSPFSLNVFDKFEDDRNSVVEIDGRRLTMSPFFDYGGSDEDDDRSAVNTENATSSVFGGGIDSGVVPGTRGPIPTAEDGKETPSDETASSPSPQSTTTNEQPVVTVKSSGSTDDNDLNSGHSDSGSSTSTTPTSTPTTPTSSATAATTTPISVSTVSMTADNSKTTAAHIIINESLDETTATQVSTTTTPTAPPQTDDATQSSEATRMSAEPAKSSEPASSPPQKLTMTTSTAILTTTTNTTSPSAVLHSTTLMMGSSGNSSGLALTPDDVNSDGEEEDDTFWPIVAALVIGIPSIIVFGIAITVIHKRRLASPARLRAASMYPSLKLDPRRSSLHLSSHSLHRSSIDV